MDYLENIIHRIEIGERKRGNGQELLAFPHHLLLRRRNMRGLELDRKIMV